MLLAVAALVGVGWYRFEGTAAKGPAELRVQGNIDVRQVNLSFKVAGRIAQGSPDELEDRARAADRPEPTLEGAFVALVEAADAQGGAG